jgi:hypothetical protein
LGWPRPLQSGMMILFFFRLECSDGRNLPRNVLQSV